MKKLAVYLIGLLMLSALLLPAAQPENFIPQQSPAILRVNANRLLNMPELCSSGQTAAAPMQKLLDQLDKVEKEAAAAGIDFKKLFSGNVWFAQVGATSQDMAIYFNTLMPEQQTAESLRKEGITPQQVAGNKVYMCKDVAVTYLAGDTIMMVQNKSANLLPQVLTASRQSAGNPLLALIDRQSIAALVVNATAFPQGTSSKVKLLNVKLDLIGTRDPALDLDAKIHFSKAEEAAKIGMQLQFAIPGFAGMLFANDEKLMSAIVSAFKIVPQDNVLDLSLDLSNENIKNIIKYFETPANRPPMPGTAAPQTK